MNKIAIFSILLAFLSILTATAQKQSISPSSNPGWQELFTGNLSDANYTKGIWTFENGILTASKDECIWTKKEYRNFILDLEFKTEENTNSGVVVYCTNTKDWIPNSVEIQILDDFGPEWATAAPTWKCGAIFGHLAPSKEAVKKAGEWNHFTITCQGQMIEVILNGERVTRMNMALWTDGKKNPDGSEIPSWLPTPFAKLPVYGYIGLQGKHADARIWFRNLKIKEIE